MTWAGDGIELTLVGYIQSRMCVRHHTEINIKLIEDSCYSIELAQENAGRMSKMTTVRLRMNRILEIIADMFEVILLYKKQLRTESARTLVFWVR